MDQDRLDEDVATTSAGPAGAWGKALPSGTRLGEFELNRVLGEGGFGIVYLAFDQLLHRNVAIKEYLPSAYAVRRDAHTITALSGEHQATFDAGLNSFIQEARLLARFEHPALVKVLRFWKANGTAYMAMPQYQGRTLRDHFKTGNAFGTEAELRSVITPLLDALEQLHGEQCFHRDVTPENIIIQPNGAPVLLDFGAARRVIAGMSQALTVVLKQNFAPIEQYSDDGSLEQGAWTDVYALAAVMYTAITRSPPPSAVARVYKDPLVPLAQSLPAGFGLQFLRGIDAGMAVRPEDRPRSIAAFRTALGLHVAEDRPDSVPATFRTALTRHVAEDRPDSVPATSEEDQDRETIILFPGRDSDEGAPASTTPEPASEDPPLVVTPGSRYLPPKAPPRRGAAAVAMAAGAIGLAGALALGALLSERGSETPAQEPRVGSPTLAMSPAPSNPPALAKESTTDARPPEVAPAPSTDRGTASAGATGALVAESPAVGPAPTAPTARAPITVEKPPSPVTVSPKIPPPAPQPAVDAAALQKALKAKELPPRVPGADGRSPGAVTPPLVIATAKPAAIPDLPPGIPRVAAPPERVMGAGTQDGPNDLSDEGRRYWVVADRGDAAAQVALGKMYAAGRGAPRSDADAARWFRKAADQGSTEASHYLGVMHATGRGVAKDPAEAVKWYRKAAEQGHPLAQNNLGSIYADGVGVPKDEAEAVQWYRRAAAQGNPTAQVNLGAMYALGKGVPKDEAEAVAWYRKAAEQGNARAQNNLAVMYTNGQGGTKDEAEAARWYRRAAEQGIASAQYYLADVYANGRGVMKDEGEAVLWYRKAAAQGYASAVERLKSLEGGGAK